MSQKQERLQELDILKGLAIIAVVTIHVVSQFLELTPKTSLNFTIALIIDRTMRFAVPAFVAASGYVLTLKYKEGKIDLKEFFRKRIFRIIPWYLVATAAIFLFYQTTHYRAELTSGLDPLWQIIFLGRMDYHLYFVPMILQLYILYPLILALFKRFRYKLLSVAFAFQLVFYYLLYKTALDDQQQYIIFATWIFYFILGIAFCFKLPKSKNFKIASILLLVLTFMLSTYDSSKQISLGINLNIATRSTNIPSLMFSTSFLLAFFAFTKQIQNFLGKVSKIVIHFGRRSYLTYLFHTIVLRVFLDRFLPVSFINVGILIILTLVVSDTIAYILGNFEKKSLKIFHKI